MTQAVSNTIPALSRISDFPYHWANATPGHPAVRFGNEVQDYRTFAKNIDAFARAMIAAGVQKGDRVCTLSTPRPEYFTCFMAAASIGAIWTGLNPKYTTGEMTRVLHDARPAVVLALATYGEDRLAETLAEAVKEAELPAYMVVFGGEAHGYQPLADFLGAGDAVSDDNLSARRGAVKTMDPALVVYTSGSTGEPKGALLSHMGLCHAYSVQTAHFGMEGAGLFCNLPINHIGCAGDLSCGPLVGGGTIIFMEQFDPLAMLSDIDTGVAHALLGVPTMLQMMTELPEFEKTNFSQVRLVCWGGAALPINVLKTLRTKGCPLGVTYGMSEVPGSITMSSLDASDFQLTTRVGKPAPGLEVRLLNDDGKVCATGEEGEVTLRHPSLLLGYFGKPEKTAEAYDKDGYFLTGDVGVFDADGYLQLVGRKKEMFKSGGYNIYPREIEMCLESHPDVQIAAVVAVPDPKFQEVGKAFVLSRSQRNVDDFAAELRDLCIQRLANYKRPKSIEIRTDLPMLPVGKVDKRQLKAVNNI
ncbi:class I adenylate-forming enzyme family protein [Sulfitobacter sp. 1A12157]|uniref:class I adenylate-forming enzyme family protein n=1 Tax=Sulfitobacter sp. 1A12157 TaxID=3368594 RepID=UPI00374681FE